MEVISIQSYALTTFVNSVSKRLFARQRPYAVACADDPAGLGGERHVHSFVLGSEAW